MYDVLFQYCKYCYLCSAVCDTICQPGKLYTSYEIYIQNVYALYHFLAHHSQSRLFPSLTCSPSSFDFSHFDLFLKNE